MNITDDKIDAEVAEQASKDVETAQDYAAQAYAAAQDYAAALGNAAAKSFTAKAAKAADNAIGVLEGTKNYVSTNIRTNAAANANLYLVYIAAYTAQACAFAVQAGVYKDVAYLKKASGALDVVKKSISSLETDYSAYKVQIENANKALNAAQRDFNTALEKAGITLERLNSLNL